MACNSVCTVRAQRPYLEHLQARQHGGAVAVTIVKDACRRGMKAVVRQAEDAQRGQVAQRRDAGKQVAAQVELHEVWPRRRGKHVPQCTHSQLAHFQLLHSASGARVLQQRHGISTGLASMCKSPRVREQNVEGAAVRADGCAQGRCNEGAHRDQSVWPAVSSRKSRVRRPAKAARASAMCAAVTVAPLRTLTWRRRKTR